MRRIPSAVSWSAGLALALGALGCNPGGVGDPCTPEDEYQENFNGFQVTETNAESRSFQCETRLCLVNHFQGRVSCRLGQTVTQADKMGGAYNPVCSIPGSQATSDVNDPDRNNINVEVPSQLVSRQADQAVYCSCRCAGPDPSARYCECPSGFSCAPVVPNLELGQKQLPGSYCIRNDSGYDENRINSARSCDRALENCGEP